MGFREDVAEKIALGRVHQIQMPVEISQEGKYAIANRLYDLYNVDIPATDRYNNWVEDFWTWKTVRGTFVKRLASYLKREYDIVMDSKISGAIGSMFASHASLEDRTYYFDFVERFNWTDGDFGDDDSCFMNPEGCRREAPRLLEENGFLAIRFFETYYEDMTRNNGLDDGFARAWVYPGPEYLTVFNGYGLETLTIARLLAQYTGMIYKKISLYNNGVYDGLLYVNGPGRGYIVGPSSVVESVDRKDFQIDEPLRCDNCGRYCQDDNYINDYGPYCDRCYDDLSRECAMCGCIVYRNADWNDENGDQLCNECWDTYYVRCHTCSRGIRTDGEQLNKVGIYYYCGKCFLQLKPCIHCGKMIHSNSSYAVNEHVCTNCYRERFVRCERCGNDIHKDKVIHIEGESTFCNPCIIRYAQLNYTNFVTACKENELEY